MADLALSKLQLVDPIDGATDVPRRVGRRPGGPKTGGRKKGTKNKITTDVKATILERGKPLELLCDIARGRKIRVGPQAGPAEPEFIYPTLDQRTSAARILLAKIVPDLKAQEITGAEGKPLIPLTHREELMTTFDLARRVAFTLSSGLKAKDKLRTTPPPEIGVVPELQAPRCPRWQRGRSSRCCDDMTENALDDLIGRLDAMPAVVRSEIAETAIAATAGLTCIPNPGPQTEAYFSKADVLLYGGQAAGGKTDLLGGLATTQHLRSLIMRRQYTDLGFLIDRVREIEGSWAGFNGSPPPKLKTDDGRLIDFGAAAQLGDERHWQGQPHDFLGLDEVVHFLEAQVRFLMGWVRSVVPGQRSRTVFASNPPETATGDFIIGMFRPWLDSTHHNPAKHGELRWYVSDPDGKDFEVDGPEPYQFPGQDKPVIPLSRTFISASLSDNPFQVDTGYDAQLDAMPEPLRSLMRDGNFMAGRTDDAWQLIPTAWIRAAMERWLPVVPAGVPMSAMAIDPAAGGTDKSTIAWRHDGWFAEIIEKPGVETPMGTEIAGLVVMHRRDNAVVVIDMGGGYGGVPYTTLEANGISPVAYKGSEKSTTRTADRKLGFYNKRSETWWKFREALDPSREGGSGIELPDDQELLSDLTSVKFSVVTVSGVMSIKAETKEDVVKRLGRSPDKGDAVMMCWSRGDASMLGQYIPRDQRFGRGGRTPKVITSKMRPRGRRKRR